MASRGLCCTSRWTAASSLAFSGRLQTQFAPDPKSLEVVTQGKGSEKVSRTCQSQRVEGCRQCVRAQTQPQTSHPRDLSHRHMEKQDSGPSTNTGSRSSQRYFATEALRQYMFSSRRTWHLLIVAGGKQVLAVLETAWEDDSSVLSHSLKRFVVHKVFRALGTRNE